MWGNLVTWRSKKQTIVARSSAKAEFHAIANGMCELLWLKQLLGEIGVKEEMPMKMYCDNKVTINISYNPIHHGRTKHVQVDRHFIKAKVEDDTICMVYAPTNKQVADVLTKALSRRSFEQLIDKLGMFNLYNLT